MIKHGVKLKLSVKLLLLLILCNWTTLISFVYLNTMKCSDVRFRIVNNNVYYGNIKDENISLQGGLSKTSTAVYICFLDINVDC